jgi:hypothetical protein
VRIGLATDGFSLYDTSAASYSCWLVFAIPYNLPPALCSRKICYLDYHRCFLPLNHPFRLDSDAFKKGNIVLEGPPRHLSGPEITDMLDNLVLKENGDEFIGYGKEHNWTHKCAL